MCPGVRPRERCFAHPLGSVVWDMHSTIAPGTLEAAIGFSVLFVAFRSKFAPTVHETVVFSLIQFLGILVLEEMCAQGQARQ